MLVEAAYLLIKANMIVELCKVDIKSDEVGNSRVRVELSTLTV